MTQHARTLQIRYTVTYSVEIPDDFAATAADVQKVALWKTNDYRDGRHPFSTEMMHDAVERAAGHAVSESVFWNYCQRIEKAFGNDDHHMEARNALVKRCTDKIKYGRAMHEIDIEAKIVPTYIECPKCGTPNPVEWEECLCSPGVKLPVPENIT